MHKIIPKKALIYWCDSCDQVSVNSHDPSTGTFYLQYGHDYNTEEWHDVVFALCHACRKVLAKELAV